MTVRRNNIVTKWEGRLIIDELVKINDNRGWLTELWRSDDEIVSPEDNPVQCYSSLTYPYVMRGPHEHVNQTDFFVTTHHEMMYEFFDMKTKEFFKYRTRPNEITRLKVSPGVVHGYRNIGKNNTITHNFTSSLFGGYRRQEEVDEIRHEETCHEKKKVIVVFGATGRLGNALVEAAYNHIGFYDYEVIPVYDKIWFQNDAVEILGKIAEVTQNKEVFFINAAGCTDTSSRDNEKMTWSNTTLPTIFGEISNTYKWNFIQISSDYIFQTSEKYNVTLSAYTRSKKLMESELIKTQHPVTLVRVANLFSDREDDLQNMIQKFHTKVRLGEKFVIDPRIVVSPTDVNILADFMVDTIINEGEQITKFRPKKGVVTINIIPDNTYSLKDFISKYYNGYDNIEEKEGLLEPWFDKFNSIDSVRIPSSEQTIINTIKKVNTP